MGVREDDEDRLRRPEPVADDDSGPGAVLVEAAQSEGVAETSVALPDLEALIPPGSPTVRGTGVPDESATVDSDQNQGTSDPVGVSRNDSDHKQDSGAINFAPDDDEGREPGETISEVTRGDDSDRFRVPSASAIVLAGDSDRSLTSVGAVDGEGQDVVITQGVGADILDATSGTSVVGDPNTGNEVAEERVAPSSPEASATEDSGDTEAVINTRRDHIDQSRTNEERKTDDSSSPAAVTTPLEGSLSGGASVSGEEESTSDTGTLRVDLDAIRGDYVVHRDPWVAEYRTPCPSPSQDDSDRTYSYDPSVSAYEHTEVGEPAATLPREDESTEPPEDSVTTENDDTTAAITEQSALVSSDAPRPHSLSYSSPVEDLLEYNRSMGAEVKLLRWDDHYQVQDKEAMAWTNDELIDWAWKRADSDLGQGTRYEKILKEWAYSVHESMETHRYPQEFLDEPRPAISFRRLTEMCVMIYAAIDPARFEPLLLRHFGVRKWGRQPETSSYCCAGEKCCLMVDFTSPGAHWVSICRHWAFYAKQRVYMDEFRSVDDYRLAMVLSCVLQARHQVHDRRRELREMKARGETLPDRFWVDIIGACPASTYFERYHRASMRPYAKAMLDCMTVIVPGRANIQSSVHRDFAQSTKATTFGTLDTVGQDATRYFAVLCRYDGQACWLADIRWKVARKQKGFYWRGEERLLPLARRAAVIDACTEVPLLPKLMRRDTKLIIRDDKELRLIMNGKNFQRLCGEENDGQGELTLDQAYALNQVVLYRGIIPIRGPFGCGKTRLIAGIIAVYTEAFPRARIFVTSETNTAIDEDLRRVVDEGHVPTSRTLRIGEMPKDVGVKYQQYYLQYLLDQCQQPGSAMRTYENRLLDQAMVVFGTTSTFGREDLSSYPCVLLINDEAAQTVECSVIQAMRPATRVFVPIGDTNQLPGRVEFREELAKWYEEGDKRHKLSWSFLHGCSYLYEKFPGVTLTAQHRCHRQIGTWVAGFYDYELSHKGPRSEPYLQSVQVGFEMTVIGDKEERSNQARMMGRARVAMISCENEDQNRNKRGGKYVNQVELWKTLELVLQIMRECKRAKKSQTTLLIITPYTEQRVRLQEVLNDARRRWSPTLEIDVVTIDSCQGREADIAIVSMTRVGGLGFLAEKKARTLVALTRAKDYMFVLAHRATFKADTYWDCLYMSAIELEIPQIDDMSTTDDAKRKMRDRPSHAFVLTVICGFAKGG